MAHTAARQCHERYEFRVDGHLDDRWSTWFGDFALIRENTGTTIFSGLVADQAELHGLLAKIRDLGLTLISLTKIEPCDAADRELHSSP
ncbi:MAG: hypothetical protein ACOH17_12360 [Cellulomonas sp.]